MNVPDDLELRTNLTQDHVIDELDRKCHLLMYGREEVGDPDQLGELTPFRSVVIVTGLIALTPRGVAPIAIGTFNGGDDPHARSTLPKLAEKLREIARDLELLSQKGADA